MINLAERLVVLGCRSEALANGTSPEKMYAKAAMGEPREVQSQFMSWVVPYLLMLTPVFVLAGWLVGLLVQELGVPDRGAAWLSWTIVFAPASVVTVLWLLLWLFRLRGESPVRWPGGTRVKDSLLKVSLVGYGTSAVVSLLVVAAFPGAFL